MSRRTILETKIRELNTRWERLSQKLNALQQQRDLETRVEEQLRVDHLIAEQEKERQKVETQLQELEEQLQTLQDTKLETKSPPVRPAETSPSPAPESPQSSTTPRSPAKVFYSYSHKDEDLRDKLDTHLKILHRQNIISGWHDRAISAGTEWEDQINENLEAADIILLLVSADFIASDYCWGKELTRAIERHHAGEARVIPIILRPVDWTGAPFGVLQALPKNAKPVTTWPNQDEVFTDIARSIRQVAESFPK